MRFGYSSIGKFILRYSYTSEQLDQVDVATPLDQYKANYYYVLKNIHETEALFRDVNVSSHLLDSCSRYKFALDKEVKVENPNNSAMKYLQEVRFPTFLFR